MSFRRNSDGGVIGYINRHVPQVTWNDLTEDECSHFLAMIRHYSREYYERPKQPRRDLDAEDRMFRHREMMEHMMRMSRYSSGFMRMDSIRPREIIVDEIRSLDFSAVEKRISEVLASKADIFKMMYSGEPGILYEESHHLKAEDLWIKKEPRDRQPRIGAGKNPFAEHTIRSMKGKRK